MVEKQITGKIFIIPNAPATEKEIGWFDVKDWEKWINKIQPKLDNFGLQAEEPMIEVWATNDEVDNFSNHQTGYAKMIGVVNNDLTSLSEEEKEEVRKKIRENAFPSHLPYSLLKGLKENDTLTLHHKNGVVFYLKVSQTTTRYARYGNFEDVLEKLV